jgi:hypothetical protein
MRRDEAGVLASLLDRFTASDLAMTRRTLGTLAEALTMLISSSKETTHDIR